MAGGLVDSAGRPKLIAGLKVEAVLPRRQRSCLEAALKSLVADLNKVVASRTKVAWPML